ncbi:MAG: hypothetical protein QNJ97_25805 [Myxococcota bacterium]|nr:hypothetical protein [Myxococcota bacterium]
MNPKIVGNTDTGTGTSLDTETDTGTSTPDSDDIDTSDTDIGTDTETSADTDTSDTDTGTDTDTLDTDTGADTDTSDTDTGSDTEIPCDPIDPCCHEDGTFEEMGTICGTAACPADVCTDVRSALTYKDYPATCDLTCDGYGTCADECTCEAELTACMVGEANECCTATCDDTTGCGSAAGPCEDVCAEDTSPLITEQSCSGCGENGALGACIEGTPKECTSSASPYACTPTTCGGTMYFCSITNDTWQWRLANSEYDCGDGCCVESESYCSCKEDCPDLPLNTTWELGSEDWSAPADSDGHWRLGTDPRDVCGEQWDSNQHSYFFWEGSVSSEAAEYYTISLVSPVFDILDCTSASLSFNLAFDEYGDDSPYPGEEFSAACYNGETWVKIWQISEHSYPLGCHKDQYAVPLHPTCVDKEDARVRFTASGIDSYHINGWHVDDVQIQ